MSDSSHRILIKLEDVELILGQDLFQTHFSKLVDNVYCNSCLPPGTSPIRIKQIWLDQQGNISIDGRCQICKNKLRQVIETRNDPDSYGQAMVIWEIREDLLRFD